MLLVQDLWKDPFRYFCGEDEDDDEEGGALPCPIHVLRVFMSSSASKVALNPAAQHTEAAETLPYASCVMSSSVSMRVCLCLSVSRASRGYGDGSPEKAA
jgi:hypothetical protein